MVYTFKSDIKPKPNIAKILSVAQTPIPHSQRTHLYYKTNKNKKGVPI